MNGEIKITISEEKKYVQYNRIVISCDLHTNLYNDYIHFGKGDFYLA